MRALSCTLPRNDWPPPPRHGSARSKLPRGLGNNRRELVELEGRRARAQHEADAARDRAEAAQTAGRLVATAQGALNTNVQKVASARDALTCPPAGRYHPRAADE